MNAVPMEQLKQRRLDLVQLLTARVESIAREMESTAKRIKHYTVSDRSPDALVASVQNSVLSPLKALPGLVAILDDIAKTDREISAGQTEQAYKDAWEEAQPSAV